MPRSLQPRILATAGERDPALRNPQRRNRALHTRARQRAITHTGQIVWKISYKDLGKSLTRSPPDQTLKRQGMLLAAAIRLLISVITNPPLLKRFRNLI
jgi:hypothetical protein